MPFSQVHTNLTGQLVCLRLAASHLCAGPHISHPRMKGKQMTLVSQAYKHTSTYMRTNQTPSVCVYALPMAGPHHLLCLPSYDDAFAPVNVKHKYVVTRANSAICNVADSEAQTRGNGMPLSAGWCAVPGTTSCAVYASAIASNSFQPSSPMPPDDATAFREALRLLTG